MGVDAIGESTTAGRRGEIARTGLVLAELIRKK
jgi:hypothetical protein